MPMILRQCLTACVGVTSKRGVFEVFKKNTAKELPTKANRANTLALAKVLLT